MKNVILKLALLLVACCILVEGIFILSFPVATPDQAGRWFSGVGGDGWVAREARVQFEGISALPELLGLPQKVVLEFDNHRPDRRSAHVSVAPCSHNSPQAENNVREFFVGIRGASIEVPMLTRCSYGQYGVEIIVKNPKQQTYPSGESREFGVQVRAVKILSPFGIPLVEMRVVVPWVFFTFALLLLSYAVGDISLSVGVLVGICWFLSHRVGFELHNQTALAIWMLCVLGGIYLAQRVGEESRSFFREQLEGSIPWLPLGLIVAAAFGLRVYDINFGLPDFYHPDEVPKINAVSRMRESGTLDPNYFLHPSLLLYCSYGMSQLLTWFGIAPELGFREMVSLGGRVSSAIAGTVTVGATFFVGRVFLSNRAGLLAAGLLAALPLHVTCSRYLKEDALVVCMTMLLVAVVGYAVRTKSTRWVYLGAVLVGLSAGSKYSGILNVVLLAATPWLVSHSIVPDMRFLKAVLLSLPLAPVAFIATTPYSILNAEQFLFHFNSERNHMLRGHTSAISAWSQLWMWHFGRSILPGMSWFSAIICTVACGFALWRRSLPALFLVACVGMFYAPAEWVKAKPAPQPDRYILPCLPFMCLCFAYAVQSLGQIKQWRSWVAAVVVGVLATATIRSVRFAAELTPDTRAKMAQYIREHLPPGSVIQLDYMRYAPYIHDPRFTVYSFMNLRNVTRERLREDGITHVVLSSLYYDRFFYNTPDPGLAAPRSLVTKAFQELPILHEEVSSMDTYGFHNPKLTLFAVADEKAFAQLDAERAAKRAGTLAATSNEAFGKHIPREWE